MADPGNLDPHAPQRQAPMRSADPPDSRSRKAIMVPLAIAGAGLVLFLAGWLISHTESRGMVHNVGLCMILLAIILFPVALFVHFFLASKEDKRRSPNLTARPPDPVGYTHAGEPIYPVVGYTPDGVAVTADRMARRDTANSEYNTMAILALVFAFLVPILAIPFGLISLSQIGRTREKGATMAMVGLLLGSAAVVVGIVGIAMLVNTK